MNGGLEALTNLFSSGGGSAGESALAPGAGVTSFLSGKDAYGKLQDQFMGANPAISGISGMGGYQGGMGAMMGENQDYLKALMAGGGGMGLDGMPGGPQQAGQQQMQGVPSPQMPGMMPNPGPPQGLPPRTGGQAPAFPAMGKLDLAMAANLLKKRLGMQ